MLTLLWIIQLAPLVAAMFIFLIPRITKKMAPTLAVAGAFIALCANCLLFMQYVSNYEPYSKVEFNSLWLSLKSISSFAVFDLNALNPVDIEVGFLVDHINLLMLTVVTIISFLVQIFSLSYMDDDKDKARYFGFLSLFSFSMIGLVLSTNLLQTFMFWELVGLTSYLLIGFYFEKPQAATAARKAFVINRLADLGFMAGLILLFLAFGSLQILDLTKENLSGALPIGFITMIGLLILTGVMGKSAQFPFHVWLPDAMEGPTPVSALIHSATMVAAGVFLLVRVFDLFALSSTTMLVILVIGTITSLLAATMATTQRDIKRVLAYSTVSQLGLMVMGIGAGSAVFGLFHLVTHAFFKSMLFLTAGALIHRYGTNDLFQMGSQGAKSQKLLMLVLCVGLASLCGIPPFAGFFSKDAILHHLLEHDFFFGLMGLVITFFTALYSFRMLMILFASKQEGGHPHEEKGILRLFTNSPLITLIILSFIAGFLGSSVFGESLLLWIDSHAHGVPFELNMLLLACGVILAGAIMAIVMYKNPEKQLEKMKNRNPLSKLVFNKYLMDDLYDFLVKKIGLGFANLLYRFDLKVPNQWLVDDTSKGVKKLGRLFSKMQNGQFQNYVFISMLLFVAVIFHFVIGYLSTPT